MIAATTLPSSVAELAGGSALPLEVAALRLGVAAAFGLVLGIQRERLHHAAGMRTHALVSIGAAMFVLATLGINPSDEATARVIQGVIQGIGFLGAGTILKLSRRVEVHGLTTAASIWCTAAIGVAVALGQYWIAGIATGIAWLVLGPLNALERRAFKAAESPSD